MVRSSSFKVLLFQICCRKLSQFFDVGWFCCLMEQLMMASTNYRFFHIKLVKISASHFFSSVYIYVLKLAMGAVRNSYLSIEKLLWSPVCVEHISHHIPNKLEKFQSASPLLPDWCFLCNRKLATNMSPVKFKNSATSPITTPISSLSTWRYSKSSIVHLFKPNVSPQDHQYYQIYSNWYWKRWILQTALSLQAP